MPGKLIFPGPFYLDGDCAVHHKVKSLYLNSPWRRKVADYLIMNGDEIEDVTSHELARRLDVGQSTVMRFEKMEYTQETDIKSSDDLSTEIQNDDGLFTVMSKTNKVPRASREAIPRIIWPRRPVLSMGRTPSFAMDAWRAVC